MKIPKKYQKIFDLFKECDREKRCLVCGDIIGFALIALRIDKASPDYSYRDPAYKIQIPFMKFLFSTIPKDVCKCSRARFDYQDIVEFARWLMELPSHEFLTPVLYCHAEFSPDH